MTPASSYEYYKKSADYILARTGFEPEIAIVLGSALGGLAEEIEDAKAIDYKDIPNFLVSTAPGHAGKLIFGTLCGKKVVCMSGRFHHYEGYTFQQLTAPVRVMKLLGVKTVILTNAAGAVNTCYSVGDIMLITDHIKLTGSSPLGGTNIPEFGPRFFDITDMYAKKLQSLARSAAKSIGLDLREGVYMYFTGPQFETPAEIRAARILGADAVGMSTVTEALTAAHNGIQVLGLSLITNMAAGVLDRPLSGAEVDEAGAKASGTFRRLMREIISKYE